MKKSLILCASILASTSLQASEWNNGKINIGTIASDRVEAIIYLDKDSKRQVALRYNDLNKSENCTGKSTQRTATTIEINNSTYKAFKQCTGVNQYIIAPNTRSGKNAFKSVLSKNRGKFFIRPEAGEDHAQTFAMFSNKFNESYYDFAYNSKNLPKFR